jgi:hypothetical protein
MIIIAKHLTVVPASFQLSRRHHEGSHTSDTTIARLSGGCDSLDQVF